MQHLATLSLNDSGSDIINRGNFLYHYHGDRSEDKLICPKPRRISIVTPSSVETIRPHLSWRSLYSIPSEPFDGGEAGHEILEIFLSGNTLGDSSGFGCSPPYFLGSPPCRAGNPVVQDSEFHRLSHSDSIVATKEAKVPSSKSANINSPSVRIEGFDCSGHEFDRAARDTCHHVAAFA